MTSRFLSAASAIVVVFCAMLTISPGSAQQPAGNATPQPPTGPPGILGRKGPPQPQLKQSLDYFVGTWSVTWSGRESAFSPGPRIGTVTYTRLADSNFLDVRGEGKVEGAGAYKETGTIGWHEGQKILALHERLASGTEVLSIGDWTSPISIRFESVPVALPGTKPVPGKPVPGQALRLRRTYGIVSAGSFTVTEEVSVDGKTFSRSGRGVFGKIPAKE